MDNSFVKIGDGKITLTLGEQDYEISEYKIGDIVDTQDYIRQKNLNMFIDNTGLLQLDAETRSMTMNKILNQTIGLSEVFSSQEYMHRFVYHVLHRNNPQITWKFVLNEMDTILVKELTNIWLMMHGTNYHGTSSLDSK